ncbi:MAG TPA: copper chaperone PCu(A)C [Nitrolancea sp.]|nr:copper chaperone PCu(A)C [Nitrolancea sp.]
MRFSLPSRPVRGAIVPALALVAIFALVAGCGTSDATPTAQGASSASGNIVVDAAWTRPMTASMAGLAIPAASPDSMGMSGMATPTGMSMLAASPAAMDMNTTDAVYFTIRNNGSAADQLLSASSAVASAVELHQSMLTNGISSMKSVSSVDVPAGGAVTFDPGNYHVMLIGLKRDLNVGDHFDLTLTFKQSGKVTVSVEVRPN